MITKEKLHLCCLLLISPERNLEEIYKMLHVEHMHKWLRNMDIEDIVQSVFIFVQVHPVSYTHLDVYKRQFLYFLLKNLSNVPGNFLNYGKSDS